MQRPLWPRTVLGDSSLPPCSDSVQLGGSYPPEPCSSVSMVQLLAIQTQTYLRSCSISPAFRWWYKQRACCTIHLSQGHLPSHFTLRRLHSLLHTGLTNFFGMVKLGAACSILTMHAWHISLAWAWASPKTNPRPPLPQSSTSQRVGTVAYVTCVLRSVSLIVDRKDGDPNGTRGFSESGERENAGKCGTTTDRIRPTVSQLA